MHFMYAGCTQHALYVCWVYTACTLCMLGVHCMHFMCAGCTQHALYVCWVYTACTLCMLDVHCMHFMCAGCTQHALYVCWVYTACTLCMLGVHSMRNTDIRSKLDVNFFFSLKGRYDTSAGPVPLCCTALH